MKQAPLFVQSFELGSRVLREVDGGGALGASLHRDTLALLDHVVLALKGFDREDHLDRADALATLLRVRLRLAVRVTLISEGLMLALTRELDEIGRQIGGWLRRLHEAS
jgi:hypothetical protein